ILLYAAARRQIDRALEMGVSEGEASVVVLVAAEPETEADGEITPPTDREHRAAERVHTLLDETAGSVSDEVTLRGTDDDRLRAFFDISDRELAATPGTLADLIHERVALLDVEK
ncbi:MAG: KEOPS complex subunit Cgi121, partial [Halobaculum sp.]